MKKQLAIFASTALLGLVAYSADASVVVSNLDPSTYASTAVVASTEGQALQIGTRPIVLSSVLFPETAGFKATETFGVYSRKADGTLGSVLFTNFALAYDSTSQVTTATVSAPFTLAAGTSYFFVLADSTNANTNWNYASSTDYSSAFGVTLPASNTAFLNNSGTYTYFSLAAFPQAIQVNGTALPAVPEPSAWALTGLALAGVVFAVRRRTMLV